MSNNIHSIQDVQLTFFADHPTIKTLSLPREIATLLFALLGSLDLSRICCVSKSWNIVASQHSLWESWAKMLRLFKKKPQRQTDKQLTYKALCIQKIVFWFASLKQIDSLLEKKPGLDEIIKDLFSKKKLGKEENVRKAFNSYRILWNIGSVKNTLPAQKYANYLAKNYQNYRAWETLALDYFKQDQLPETIKILDSRLLKLNASYFRVLVFVTSHFCKNNEWGKALEFFSERFGLSINETYINNFFTDLSLKEEKIKLFNDFLDLIKANKKFDFWEKIVVAIFLNRNQQILYSKEQVVNAMSDLTQALIQENEKNRAEKLIAQYLTD